MLKKIITKYCLEENKKNFLIEFLNSYIDTFKPRYGYVDFSHLYDYATPIYFEKCLKLCDEITQHDDTICNHLEEFYKKIFMYPDEDDNTFKANLFSHIPTDFTSLIGKNIKHQPETVDFSFLKYKNSIFVLEKSKFFIEDILIVLPSFIPREELFEHEENFLSLLKSLYQDFYSVKDSRI